MNIAQGDMQLARAMLFDIANLQAAGKADLAATLIATALSKQREAGGEEAKRVVRMLWCVIHQLPGKEFQVDLTKYNPSGMLRVSEVPNLSHIQVLEALDSVHKADKQ